PQAPPRRGSRSGAACSSAQDSLQGSFQSRVAGRADLERQAESLSRALRLLAQFFGLVLREPDDPLVVAGGVAPALRGPGGAGPAPSAPVEALDEEVREEMRARLVLGAVDLVAGRAGEALVAGKVGAAVRVRDDDVVPRRSLLDGGADPLGAVVQLGRHRADL